MSWTAEHDLILSKEILFMNPYRAKKKSVQRSGLWQRIADNLNSVDEPRFSVEKRSVRDHIAILIQRFKRKEAAEAKESGTTPERTELDNALEQIIAMEESAEMEQQENGDDKREKIERDRAKAEDMRLKAMETMGETNKRKEEQGMSNNKKRRSGNETLIYLQEKAVKEQALRN